MVLKKYRYILICLMLVFSAVGLIVNPQRVSAKPIDKKCSEIFKDYYDGKFTIKKDEYSIYAKLGKRGQSSEVQLDIQTKSECSRSPKKVANGETWVKLGDWVSTENQQPEFILYSDLFEKLPDANRPQIMLVSNTDSVCIPDKNCQIKIGNATGYIEPIKSSLSDNDLVISTVTNPKQDKIEKVEYYANNQFLYSTPTLEEFNTKLVPGGKQTLSRVIVYESGQKVVLENTITISFTKDFQHLLYRTFNSNRTWLRIVGILFVLAIIGSIALLIARLLHKRKIWKISHGLAKSTPTQIQPTSQIPNENPKVSRVHDFIFNNENLTKIIKISLPIFWIISASFLIIILVDSYIVEIFRVDGVSMERTLKTDDKLLVNKTPQTWAQINGQKFIPKRGEIIIFTKPIDITSSSKDQEIIYVVKRVLGLPGERVTVSKGIVTVYNKENPKGFNPDKNSSWEKTYYKGNEDNLDVRLAENEIFVSGDNRPESLDSRINGPIDLQYIVGRVNSRILPFKDRQNL